MDQDEELFACAYCEEIVTKFPFVDQDGSKHCSPFCRRKSAEEKKARIEAREADSPDTLPRKAG